ncbi:MAG: phosphate/phosphite/phosphonate ABC transporter substrate-binding protein [Gemmataceae bacterium]|nr:phosphate/phosphite/phosphonate ABC transporter substrate-binding protein [Gemmataceae bacterium]
MLRACAVALVPLAAVGLGAVPGAAGPATPAPGIKLGLNRGMFPDVAPAMIQAAAVPFRDLLKKQSGLDGEVELVDGHDALAAKLTAREVQFGVFHGFEWAWVRPHHPDLQALAVTVPPGRRLHACLVVNKDAKAESPADLTAGTVLIPGGTKGHCRLFLDRLRPTLPDGAAKPEPAPEASTDEVLGRVALGTAAAALVDEAALSAYQNNKPGAGRLLRVLARSEPFPPAAVVYRRGAVDPTVLDKIRSGLVKATATAQGKAFLFLWNLKGFEDVSPAYEADLQQVLKAYPPPK